MARIRSIKPDFFLDEGLAETSIGARLVFIGLWCQADREGRVEDRPRKLKVTILPFDNADIDALLAELAASGHIVRYAAGGKNVIQIRAFVKHQHPHPKEPASDLPAPEPESRGKTFPAVEINGESGGSGYGSGSGNGSNTGSGSRARAREDRVKAEDEQNSAQGQEPGGTAFDWLNAFKIAWREKRNGTMYGQASDSKATAALGDRLALLTKVQRERAWNRRARILAAYLALTDKAVFDAGHMFSFFVTRFDGLAFKPAPTAAVPYHKPAPPAPPDPAAWPEDPNGFNAMAGKLKPDGT